MTILEDLSARARRSCLKYMALTFSLQHIWM